MTTAEPRAVSVSGGAGFACAFVGNDRSTHSKFTTSATNGGRLDAGDRFLQAIVGNREREPDVALATRAVRIPGRDDDIRLLEHELGERGGSVPLGHAGPEVRSRAWRADIEPDLVQRARDEISSALVDLGHLVRELARLGE